MALPVIAGSCVLCGADEGGGGGVGVVVGVVEGLVVGGLDGVVGVGVTVCVVCVDLRFGIFTHAQTRT